MYLKENFTNIISEEILNEGIESSLLKILSDANLRNEDGEHVTSFEKQNRDSKDFMEVAKWTLKRMLVQAYEAGAKGS